MSLLPLLLNDEVFDLARPSRILDQHFGLGLEPEDLLAPLIPHACRGAWRPHYYRPWRVSSSGRDVGSTVSLSKDNFQVNLDVQQFSPEEITVSATDDNVIIVEGKHAEKQDEHGFISRHFVRKYIVPKGHDVKQAVSSLSSDGILTISAPKCEDVNKGSRLIQIQQTGKPSRPAQKAQGEGDEKK